MKENAAAKARRYLGEGRLVVEQVRAGQVTATVRGDGERHRVAWRPDAGWSCSCPARSLNCAHLIGVRLIVAIDLEETA